ncbi:spidroin-1-like [Selaginella moellendorffii]|uniref:spidroin-1-like n=1 Tax=Selaginella moellendorffii TaxID=88036 RepID=UPI000D1C55D3|nr:spidroin-1-like [Selaginella moellendorffii]|eukprot:XP_024523573.1 spidroin-1-like [Selaginella moellendorffii]
MVKVAVASLASLGVTGGSRSAGGSRGARDAARRWAARGGTGRYGWYRASLGGTGRYGQYRTSLGGTARRWAVPGGTGGTAWYGRRRASQGDAGRYQAPLVGQRMLAQAVVVAASAYPARVGARGAALGGDWRRAAVRSSPWCCLALLGRPSRGALGGGCSPERWVWQPRAAGRAVAAAAAAGVGWVGGCCCWQGRAAVAAAVAIWG